MVRDQFNTTIARRNRQRRATAQVKDGSKIKYDGISGAKICCRYDVRRVSRGLYEQHGPDGERVTVVFASDGSWKWTHRFAGGGVEHASGADPVELEYYLDPGTLQDEGYDQD